LFLLTQTELQWLLWAAINNKHDSNNGLKK